MLGPIPASVCFLVLFAQGWDGGPGSTLGNDIGGSYGSRPSPPSTERDRGGGGGGTGNGGYFDQGAKAFGELVLLPLKLFELFDSFLEEIAKADRQRAYERALYKKSMEPLKELDQRRRDRDEDSRRRLKQYCVDLRVTRLEPTEWSWNGVRARPRLRQEEAGKVGVAATAHERTLSSEVGDLETDLARLRALREDAALERELLKREAELLGKQSEASWAVLIDTLTIFHSLLELAVAEGTISMKTFRCLANLIAGAQTWDDFVSSVREVTKGDPAHAVEALGKGISLLLSNILGAVRNMHVQPGGTRASGLELVARKNSVSRTWIGAEGSFQFLSRGLHLLSARTRLTLMWEERQKGNMEDARTHWEYAIEDLREVVGWGALGLSTAQLLWVSRELAETRNAIQWIQEAHGGTQKLRVEIRRVEGQIKAKRHAGAVTTRIREASGGKKE